MATAAPMSRFRRLTITHAAMMGGDAAMLVALADSLFLSIDPSAARSRVLLFLVVSFAPFLLVAPLIGPAIDRAAGGRRTVIQLIAGTRVVLALLIAASLHSLRLFPLVFVALVLQKAYIVSKQALVPSIVRSDSELVEANSKLGVIAGLTGFVAIIPAALIQLTPARGWGTLIYSGALFGFALASATRLPADVVAAAPAQSAERVQLHSPAVQLAAAAMLILRASVGFVFFLLAFWLRTQTAGTAWFAVAVGLSAVGTIVGNAIAPQLRKRAREELMLVGSLALSAVAGLGAAFLGGVAAGVMLAVAVNFSAAVGRLAFESIVQRDAPQANRGRAFARFETRFQLAWAIAGLIPVVIEITGWVGFLIVGLVCSAAVVNYVAGTRSSSLRLRHRRSRRHPSRARPAPGRPLPPPRSEGRPPGP
jgi:Major Facilitator Superfamily